MSTENASRRVGSEGKGIGEHSVEGGDCRVGESKDSYKSNRMSRKEGKGENLRGRSSGWKEVAIETLWLAI